MNASSVALSGLHVAELRLSTSAHNIANALTPGYRRHLVLQEEEAATGVKAVPTRMLQEGENLADDLLDQKAAAEHLGATLRGSENHDCMLGVLLDATA